MKCISLVGSVFGRLTVIDRDVNDKKGNSRWICNCLCGKTKTILRHQLTSGKTKSCGCINHEQMKAQKYSYKHGHCSDNKLTKTHNIWRNIRQRCNNPNNKDYKYYGARGITVCSRWEIFENFLADMGVPSDKDTIDRIDTYSGYSKENCRWVTIQENLQNRGYKYDKDRVDGDFSLVGYISTNDDFFKSIKNTDEEYNEQPTFITYSKAGVTL